MATKRKPYMVPVGGSLGAGYPPTHELPTTAVLSSLVPNTRPTGFITFEAIGTGFQPGAEVLADGVVLPMVTYEDATRLTVENFHVVNPQTAMVSVRNPGEAETNSLPFTVTPLTTMIDMSGASGNYLSAADAPEFYFPGDLCLVALVAPDDWSPGGTQAIVAQWAGQLAFLWYLMPTGELRFAHTLNGSTQANLTTGSLAALPNGSPKWVAYTHDIDNGAGGRDGRFWTSDDSVAWTQLGATASIAGVGPVFNSTARLNVGASDNGVWNRWAGRMFRVSIRDGIGPGGTVGGTEVFRLDESDVPNPSVTSFTAFTGQTITVHGSVLAPAP